MHKKEDGPVRYDMSHGEILRSDATDTTLNLSSVIYILYGRESVVRLKELEGKPLKIPEGAMISIQYRTPQHALRAISGEAVLQLSDEEIAELRQAILDSGTNSRPIVSYSNTTDKNSDVIVRFITVYMNGHWECVQAANITYEEANFVYELLVHYGLAH